MKYYCYLLVTTILFIVILSLSVKAQSDSTYLDLGRVKLRRDLTQHVIIKGEDLEKLPFTNLSEAISAWFYGRFATHASFIYVIDGSLLHDVNMYNIHDIKEVTIVQNALVQLNGALNAQHLVLVTTRRNQEAHTGIVASVQTGLISRQTRDFSNYEGKPVTPLYSHNRYSIAAQKQTGKNRLGFTASFLNNEDPGKHNVRIMWAGNTPFRLNDYESPKRLSRTSVTGFIDTPLSENHCLLVSAGYTYQSYHHKNVNVDLLSLAARELINSIPSHGSGYTGISDQGGHTHVLGTEASLRSDWGHLRNTATFTHQSAFNRDHFDLLLRTSNSSTSNYSLPIYNPGGTNVLFRDQIQYDIEIDDWTLEPALNISLRATDEVKLMMTPSISLYAYENTFQVQAGFLALRDIPQPYATARYFPFIFASTDLCKLFEPSSKLSWKLYASYANGRRLDSFNPSLVVFQSPQNSSGVFYSYHDYHYKQKNLDLGSTLSLLNNTLSVSYNYNNRTGNSFSSEYYPEPAHWLGINFTAINTNKTQWLTQFTVLNNGYRTSSGWANRINSNKAFVGFDITTHLKEMVYELSKSGPFSPRGYHTNTVGLQNFYAGYKVKTKGIQQVDVYVFGNNLINTSPNRDWYRKYYGLGATFAL